MEDSKEKSPCRFCTIRQDELLVERPLAYLRRDAHPLTEGHALIIPKRHVATFFETTAEERAEMLRLLDEAKKLFDRQFHPDGYNLGLNDGPAAGQTIMHVHMHVIPRYLGDATEPRGGIRWMMPERAEYWRKKKS